MAKLSARGRTELVRLQRFQNENAPLDDRGEVKPLIRTELVLMSDRKVLRKVTFIRLDGSRHDTGWKVIGKLKEEKSTQDFIAIYTEREPKFEQVS